MGACERADGDGGAWRLSRLVVIQEGGPALCDSLLGALGLSDAQLAGLAPSLRDLARDVGRPEGEDVRTAALEVLAAAARLQPEAVLPSASLGWTHHEAALAVEAGAVATRRVPPLLRLLAALVAARGSTQPAFHFLCRHGASCARMGAVVPTVAALAAHPRGLARTGIARAVAATARTPSLASRLPVACVAKAPPEALEISKPPWLSTRRIAAQGRVQGRLLDMRLPDPLLLPLYPVASSLRPLTICMHLQPLRCPACCDPSSPLTTFPLI